MVPFDITARDVIGRSVSKEETKDILPVIEELFANRENYSQQIEELKNSYFYNLGNSGEAAAEYIISRLNRFANTVENSTEKN